MSAAMMNLVDNIGCEDDSIVAALCLNYNGSQSDENSQVDMMIEGSARIRSKLTELLLNLADKLDEANAKHIAEIALCRQQVSKIEV